MSTLGAGTLGSGTLGDPGGSASALAGEGFLAGSILLADLYFDGGYSLARVATDWWYSRAADSIGVQEWQDRIISEPTYSVQLGCATWGNKTSVSVGSIEVADPAGELDWMQRKTRDSLCVLRIARQGQSYDETQIVGRAIVDSVEMTGSTKVVKLRGIDTLLDRPLQSTLYSAATAVSSSSSTSTTSESIGDDTAPPSNSAANNVTIEGQRVPVVLGRVWQAEPVLVDPQDLRFQITDAGIVEIVDVLSGGSVANPPNSSGEDWDYANLRTGFRMTISPSARITANVDGIRALTDPIVFDRFSSDTAFSSNGIVGWTVTTSTSGQAVAQIVGVGAQLTADAGEASGPSISRSISASEDDWVVVLIDVLDMSDGYLTVSLGTPKEIRREGRHALILPMGAGADLEIAGVTDATGCDITIGSVYAYELQASVGTESLVEMMRHVTIARGALPDADTTQVDVISLGSGDFDTSGDLNTPTVETSNATVAVAGGVLDVSVGDLASSGFAVLQWPAALMATGERYTLTADVVVSALTPTASLLFRFDPDSLAPSAYITLQTVASVGTHAIGATFEPTEPGTLAIVSFADPGGQIEFTLDNLHLTMLDFSDDGATVDFDSLAEIDAGYQFGLVSEDSTTVREVANRVLDSVVGWMFPDPSGRLRFGRLAPPSGASALTISRVNMTSRPVYTPDLAPGLSDTFAGARNWSAYSDAELAGITYPNRPPFRADYRAKRRGASAEMLARPYTHAVGAESIPTLIYDPESVQAEADRVTAIYTTQQGFWEVEVALSSAAAAATIRPDMTVTLDDPLFEDDNGKRCRVVGVEGRYRSQVVKLTLWGATNG